ncbi:uncharacterized protein BDR25DRAFT_363240 [Lindgomyces ingoldianus]|uniref:Uncharacterized protein n=1 Tax=Lindgomyces ingoldianus TaxID=673940 RepID=A0ACB6Q7R4_9PLEO|nr:uncharacterized protein BDR25DRAFT_363240 [Lindgomyces ingoldianus]KAF2463034.1 hypothetical protein BDR25DRAFT_363240 [Lindgomyces ingoldianus]
MDNPESKYTNQDPKEQNLTLLTIFWALLCVDEAIYLTPHYAGKRIVKSHLAFSGSRVEDVASKRVFSVPKMRFFYVVTHIKISQVGELFPELWRSTEAEHGCGLWFKQGSFQGEHPAQPECISQDFGYIKNDYAAYATTSLTPCIEYIDFAPRDKKNPAPTHCRLPISDPTMLQHHPSHFHASCPISCIRKLITQHHTLHTIQC